MDKKNESAGLMMELAMLLFSSKIGAVAAEAAKKAGASKEVVDAIQNACLKAGVDEVSGLREKMAERVAP